MILGHLQGVRVTRTRGVTPAQPIHWYNAVMDSERLARYLAGEASPAERAQVAAWAGADAANATELDRLQAAWAARETPGAWDVDRAWTRLDSRLATATASVDLELMPVARRSAYRWLAAAAVLVVAGAGVWLATRSGPRVYETAVGERRQISLPDGSEVVLAPASRLTIQPGYGKSERSLLLDGRAWFEVHHDEARPFRVRARLAVVEDLGTEFEIDATSPEIKVAVVSGSVSVTIGSGAPMMLGPQDLGRVGPAGQGEVVHRAAVERLIAWRKGTLAFENRPVGQVLDEMERWYDVMFNAPVEVRGRTFTGDLPTDRLDDALATIGAAVGLTALRTERVITLAFKAAP